MPASAAADYDLELSFQAAREYLLPFVVLTKPDYVAEWFHREIAAALEAVERGEITRLIIEAPPRSGKSELTTVRFPAWLLSRHPNWPIIVASYNDELAAGFGGKARDCLAEASRMGICPGVRVRADSSSKTNWSTNHGGDILYTGMGGTVSGKGAKLLVIEDPIKNQEEANSETCRERLWGFYTTTLKTRLEGEGRIVINMTRWGEDDLVGRVLKHEPGKWTVIRLPMLAEQDEPYRKAGECLYPSKFPQAEVETLRAELQATPVGRQTWAALYQQAPYSDAGGHFLLQNWKFYKPNELPEGVDYHTWDTAFKTGQENDNTAGHVIRICEAGHYLRYSLAQRMEYPALIRAMKNMNSLYPASLILVEDKASGQSALQTLRAETALPIKGVKVGTDKLSRAQSGIQLQSTGRIFLPEGAPWVEELIREFAAFPNGQHDDQVDAYSQYANEIAGNSGKMTWYLPGV